MYNYTVIVINNNLFLTSSFSSLLPPYNQQSNSLHIYNHLPFQIVQYLRATSCLVVMLVPSRERTMQVMEQNSDQEDTTHGGHAPLQLDVELYHGLHQATVLPGCHHGAGGQGAC